MNNNNNKQNSSNVQEPSSDRAHPEMEDSSPMIDQSQIHEKSEEKHSENKVFLIMLFSFNLIDTIL